MTDTISQICPAAKKSRTPFSHSCVKTTAMFELIHIDIWGPYQTKTSDGCNQFLTIVDDFSRYSWVHLLKHKNQVTTVLHNFASYAENQFKTTIKSLRSDNAKEFCEGSLQVFFLQKGIIHQRSCVYTP